MNLTDQDKARVAEIERLHAAATPGTWFAVDRGNTVPSHAVARYATGEKTVNIASGISPKTGNAEFIVNAHGAIPWLLSLIRRLSEQPSCDTCLHADGSILDYPCSACIRAHIDKYERQDGRPARRGGTAWN